jgi:hypothetical protein
MQHVPADDQIEIACNCIYFFFAVIWLASKDAFADVHYARPLTGH